ncbi:hypothetical protein MTO96_052063 [Rhipicephalus appendiculatus]
MATSDAAAAWTAKLAEYRSQYERVRKLIDVDSGSDPATEPYRSKYEARRILKELLEDLSRVEVGDAPRKDFIRAVAKYELGVIATDTEEVSLGQEYLEECLRIVGEERYADPESRLTVVCALNQLGIVHVRRGDATKALEYLKKAEAIYAKVSSSPEEMAKTVNPADLFLPNAAAEQAQETQLGAKNPNFELANAHTLYYLAQVYENLGENAKAAMYCHSTLKKELTLENFDSIDWSINAATLSQFFIARGDFAAGRHLLACSSHVLNEYQKKLDAETSTTPEEKAEKEDKLRHRFADVARCWAKYGLFLLIASREQLDTKTSGKPNGLGADKKPHVLIKSPEVSRIEEDITDKLVTDFEGARPVFLKSQKWLEDAKAYYTLKDHATDYIEIIQEISKLYRELASFEPARPEIMFELGEIYSEMMSLKLAALPTAVSPQSPAVKKVNTIIDKAIRHYTSFINTVRDPGGKLPEPLPEDLARPVLVGALLHRPSLLQHNSAGTQRAVCKL